MFKVQTASILVIYVQICVWIDFELIFASRFFFPDEIDSLPVEQSAHAGCEEINWPRMFEDSVPDAIAHLFAETTELSAEQVR